MVAPTEIDAARERAQEHSIVTALHRSALGVWPTLRYPIRATFA